MEWKLVALLALFAACGSVHAEDDFCSTYCKQVEGSGTRHVVRGQKHRASRSKGHLPRANRQGVSDEIAEACSSYCRIPAGRKSSRQGQGFGGLFSSGFPFNVFSGGSSGSGSSGSGSGSSGGGSGSSTIPSQILGMPGEMMNSVFGSESSSGFPFNFLSGSSGGESGSSDSGSGSSGSGVFGFPGQVANQIFGGGDGSSSQFPFSFLNPFGSSSGSSDSGSESSGSGSSGSGSGSSGSGLESSDSGSGSSGSGSESSGSGSGISSFFRTPEEAYNAFFGDSGSSSGIPFSAIEEAFSGGSGSSQGSGQSFSSICQDLCGFTPFSRARRVQSSGRKGASHVHKERHGRHPIAAQHTRQSGSSSSSSGCPNICRFFDSAFPGSGSSSQGSSTGSSGGSTGDSGTSSSGSDGSSTGSSGSSGDSTSGTEESSTGK